MYPVLFGIGWLFSKLPEFVMKGICWCLGALFYTIPSKRRQIIASNLHHAFPERSPEWLQATVKKVCHRTVEMGLFTLVVPHFSMKRFGACIEEPNEADAMLRYALEQQRPVMLLGMHFSMIEAFNVWPAVSKVEFPVSALMYRPHKNPKIDALIKNHRERAGLKLVSRKQGIRAIGEAMRANGIAAVLFDQNTRDQGSLLPFFGRVTAATDLQGILAKKYNPLLFMTVCHRIGFWRGRIEVEQLNCEMDADAVTLASNQWLEDKLRSSDEYLVDWLWSHNRWKILFRPFERLGMNHRKKITDFSTYPVRKTRIALLHQNIGLEETQAVAFLQALRKSRPDAEISLISRGAEDFQKNHKRLVDIAHDLYESSLDNLKLAKAMRDHYLDVVLVMDDHVQSLRFAKKSKVPQRFGISLNGKKPAGLTEIWQPEDPYQWSMDRDWIPFGKHFGLEIEGQDAN